MSRVDISIGLLAILVTMTVTALVGLGEERRMQRASRGWQARKIELGAELFNQYCSNCHGVNASGGICPPLDQTSGLHGGDLGAGIAWRLEEQGWDPALAYEYIYGAIAVGRTVSTRPQRYPGNRVPGTEGERVMAMPAWGQDFGGPLRRDQIEAITLFLVSFADALPQDPEAALATAQAYRATLEPPPRPTATATLTGTLTSTVTASLTGTPEAATAVAPVVTPSP